MFRVSECNFKKNVVVGSALARETWKHFQVLQTEAVSIVGLFIVFAYRISDRTVLKKKVFPQYTRRCDFCPSQVKVNLIFLYFNKNLCLAFTTK